MKLKKLSLTDFGAFAYAEMPFADGINVFIGENSTGKSHVLKLVYSILKTAELEVNRARAEIRLSGKLAAVFKPDDGRVGRLVRRKVGRGHANVVLETTRGSAKLRLTNLDKLTLSEWQLAGSKKALFLPSRELLTIYEGFIGTYENRELQGFDDTYYDGCVALNAPLLRGPREQKAASLLKPMQEALGGRVARQGDRFYVTIGGGSMEATLVAEGLRKIATLVYLIANGSLQQNGVLFWDEPEASLNPRLIGRVVNFLQTLASSGVQVFLATHDYLLARKLSLAAEYRREPRSDIRFFSFARDGREDSPVLVDSGDTLADLAHNALVEEFVDTYDEELKLFREEQIA